MGVGVTVSVSDFVYPKALADNIMTNAPVNVFLIVPCFVSFSRLAGCAPAIRGGLLFPVGATL